MRVRLGESPYLGFLCDAGVSCVSKKINIMPSSARSAGMPRAPAHVSGDTCAAITTQAAPLCRHRDPGDSNPLAIEHPVGISHRSGDLRGLNRRGRGTVVSGRGRGRDRGRGLTFGLEPARPSRGGRGRGRRGCRAGRRRRGRGVTMEEEQEEQPER